MTTLILLMLIANFPGDVRVRGSYSFPEPRGIRENYWEGGNTYFYQRLRLYAAGFDAVLLTEKDRGEQWGDLVTGGIRYSSGNGFSAAAGALSVQFAHGLVLDHSGSWGSANPLALSKALSHRVELKNAESPGDADTGPLMGIATEYSFGSFTLAAVAARSHFDPSGTGLHRSPPEILARGSLTRDLMAFRAGCGPAGLSFALVSDNADTLETSGSRIGADLHIEGVNSVLTGEFSTDLSSSANFAISASRGSPDLRHGVTVSRNTGQMNETSEVFSTEHRFGAGYGLRWRLAPAVLVDGGILYLRGETDDRVKAGLQFTQSLQNRTELSQRFTVSYMNHEQTLNGRVSAGWNPHRDVSLTLKVPLALYSDTADADETGVGVELRLKHRVSDLLEYSLSASGCSTDGWNSRVYAYTLSFPGEFGSTALYGRTVLLQASVSLHIDDRAVLRLKGGWYRKEGEDTLGSGWEETEGPSRTEAGVQLDWNFE